MNLLRSAARMWRAEAPVLVLVGRLGVVGLGVMSTMVIARAIGPEGRGETAAVIALFYLAPIALALGVPTEVRRRVAEHERFDLGPAYRRYSLVLLPVSLALALALGSTLLTSLRGPSKLVAIVGLSLAPVTVAWMCDVSVLLARHRFRRFFVLQLMQPAVFFTLISVSWALGFATTAIVLVSNLVGTIATAAFGWWATRSEVGGQCPTVLNLVGPGLKFFGAAMAEAASNRLDQVLVLPLIGATQSGLYSAAVTISGVPLTLGHAVAGWYFTPIVAVGQGVRRDLLKSEAVRVALALGAASSLVLGCSAPWLIRWLFGAEFHEALRPTLLGLVGSVAMVGAYVAAQVLAAEGRGLAMTGVQLSALASSLAFLFALAPRGGASGAALASSLGYLVLLSGLFAIGGWAPRSVMPRPRDVFAGFAILTKGQSRS